MNQKKQYLKKCSDIRQYKRSTDIFPKLCLSCWKSHLKHAVVSVSAFLKDQTEVNIPSYQEQINMCLTCQARQVLHLVLLLQQLSQHVKTVKA